MQQNRKEKIREKNMRRRRKIKEAKAGGTYCPTMQRKAKKKGMKRRRKEKEATAKKNVPGKSYMLNKIPNYDSQLAELDGNIMKEFCSTCGKQSDNEKHMCYEHSNRNGVEVNRQINEDAMSKGSLPFAPITPEKAFGAEEKIASQMHNICTYERWRLEHNMEKVDRDATKRVRPEIGRQEEELQHECNAQHFD